MQPAMCRNLIGILREQTEHIAPCDCSRRMFAKHGSEPLEMQAGIRDVSL
jgi:hypothetical protein